MWEGVYFNDFIKSNLANDNLNRVIMNGMSGSSWRFKRFDRLCITVNSESWEVLVNENIFHVTEFIEKFARVKESEDEMEHDDAGGDGKRVRFGFYWWWDKFSGSGTKRLSFH